MRPALPAARALRRPVPVALLAWALLVGVMFTLGQVTHQTEDAVAPMHAFVRLLTWQLLPAAAFAAVAIAVLPPLARRLPWRRLLLLSWAVGAAWAVVLAVSEGWSALHAPLDWPTEYPAGLAAVRADPAGWLRTFTDRLNDYPTHVKGHPPLPTLTLWALDAIGLPGTSWAAAFLITTGSSSIIAIALTVRTLAGEETARRALPYLALAPFALFVATSMDVFFLFVAAWGTALLAHRRPLPAGLLLGALPFLSYGLLPMFAVPAAVALIIRPRWIPLLAGLAVVPVAFTLGGFWWPDGVLATKEAYDAAGGSARRPYWFFLFGNYAVLALLTGPAVAAALPAAARALRQRMPPYAPVALLAAAALLGTLALDLSGVTKGEVERIWVPFAGWIVPIAALHRTPGRAWLGVQAATAIAVQALLHTGW
ncbi:hypothetical protein [Actinomadura macrotermitis]|uniref:Integral membrane protein n=1 Tax=Actinomadura macrotermitis TaxID=2585200 RepID=A0A7K0BU83_9ACTN|nr:hypothetical protein [Actinomadura macrotermitis]MQY04711.1 hypothetical protein [Actinomadura macrotermitis]